jgi:hypothetical protein
MVHALYSTPNIIAVTELRVMKWEDMWHELGRRKLGSKFQSETLKERDHLEDMDVDGIRCYSR